MKDTRLDLLELLVMVDNVPELVEEARENGATPRVHGNGFIQLDLDEFHRLHVWGVEDIPHQKVNTEIHDHIFDFDSITITGALINVLYSINENPDGKWQIYEPTIEKNKDTKLTPTGIFVDATPARSAIVSHDNTAGYHMKRGDFHRTIPLCPTATLIRKYSLTIADKVGSGIFGTPPVEVKVLPRVLVDRRQEPDNEFDRNTALDHDTAWQIIHDVLEKNL